MKIWAHTITFNEENFIWFSLMSVVDFVDKILVWDTGSTDDTVKIINEVKKIKGDKIDFKQYGKPEDRNNISKIRQEMLDESECDFLMVLDADEVWWENSISKVVQTIKQNSEIEGVVTPFYNLIGDIYHYQDELAGQYQLLGKKGHLQLKFFSRKIPGLYVNFEESKIKKGFFLEGFYDQKNNPIQTRENLIFVDVKYLHFSHLRRSRNSRKEANRFKAELGNKFSEKFKYPEVFYKKYPEIIQSPWIKMSRQDLILASVLTPLKKIKRGLKL